MQKEKNITNSGSSAPSISSSSSSSEVCKMEVNNEIGSDKLDYGP